MQTEQSTEQPAEQSRSDAASLGPLVAWQYALGDDPFDDGVQIVFARSEKNAELRAGRDSGGGRGDRTEVTRVPDFDKYVTSHTKSGDNPTTEQFWNEGYTVTCWECEHRISGDDPCSRCQERLVEEAAELLEGDAEVDEDAIEGELGSPVADEHGNVYCSQACLDRLVARHERQKARKAEAKAAFAAEYPYLRIVGVSICGVGECKGKPEDGYHERHRYDPVDQKPRKKTCHDVDGDNAVVRFKVPGGELSEKTSDGNAHFNNYCHRCGGMWIARGDYPAFECLSVRPDVVVPAPPAAPPADPQ
jgi:hypothetical protein